MHNHHGLDVLISGSTAIEYSSFEKIVHFLFVIWIDAVDRDELFLPVLEVLIILKRFLKIVFMGVNHFEQ
jgi:hypothetical protein